MIICEDCIHKDVCGLEGYYEEALKFCANKIEERPTGEWVLDKEHSITMDFYKCTNCNYFGGNNSYCYCPRCGADMRGERK